MPLVGEIPFDDTVMQSINELKPITCYADSAACIAVLQMWEKLKEIIDVIQKRKLDAHILLDR